jgi:ribosomal protein S20
VRSAIKALRAAITGNVRRVRTSARYRLTSVSQERLPANTAARYKSRLTAQASSILSAKK